MPVSSASSVMPVADDAAVRGIALSVHSVALHQRFAALALGVLCALTALSPATAFAQDAERRTSPAEDTALRRDANFLLLSMAEDLAVENGARSLALAARLRTMALEAEAYAMGREPPFEIVDPKAARWLEQSERLSKDDAVAIALILPLLRDTDPQCHADAVRRWRDAEPDNLVPLLMADLTEDALLAAARGTFRADGHFSEILRLVVQTVQRPRNGPVSDILERVVVSAGPGNRDTYAASLGSAVAGRSQPSFTALVRYCRDSDDASRLQCRHAAEVLQGRGDTLLARMVGIGLLRDTAADDAQRAQAEAARRRQDWLSARNAELAARDLGDHSARFVRNLGASPVPNEIEILESVLLDSGIPLDPPAGWNRETDPALRPQR